MNPDRIRRALERGGRNNSELKQFLASRGFQLFAHEPVHNVRRAHVIAHILDHYPAALEPDDLLAGRYAERPLTGPEREEWAKAESVTRLFRSGFRYGPGSGGTGGHRTIDFETVLTRGIQSLLEEIAERSSAVDYSQPEDAERGFFYRASKITLEALLRFVERYQAEAERLAASSSDPESRRSMESLAGILARVPRFPARDFREALQAAWIVQFAVSLSDDTSCSGRPDQYLWRYYERDLRNKTLCREEALALIEEFFLRSNEVYGRWPETVMLAGSDPAGRFVWNDLTELFLKAIDSVGLINPNVAVCYRPEMTADQLALCLEPLANGRSHPAFYNDRLIVRGLVEAGLTFPDACHYQNSTCVEITPIGTSNVQVVQGQVNLAKIFEFLFNDGREVVESIPAPDPGAMAVWRERLQKRGLICAGRPPESFEAFFSSYLESVGLWIREVATKSIEQEYVRARYGSCPLVSCFIQDCIARGKDAANGGARYNFCGFNLLGFSTSVDSLAALRYAVYDKQLLPFEEFARIVASDFSGAEDLRQSLLRKAPKYGEDDPATDAIARRLFDFVRAELARYRTALGGSIYIGVFAGWGRAGADGKPRGAHVAAGEITGATPDGRHSGKPLSENIGPAPGSDRKGLTAAMLSATAMDQRDGFGGISFNCRITRRWLDAGPERESVAAMIRTFMDQGGFQLQMNTVDDTLLRQAQENPEEFRSLTVRIAGYSDYFCSLSRAQQSELIARKSY